MTFGRTVNDAFKSIKNTPHMNLATKHIVGTKLIPSNLILLLVVVWFHANKNFKINLML